ncbi:MAG: thiosulfate oxidation carrier protein SoxY [Lautropia sp.]|nr:thiosulfate oxidation carrier protein SoxY [Lautropia sp.]
MSKTILPTGPHQSPRPSAPATVPHSLCTGTTHAGVTPDVAPPPSRTVIGRRQALMSGIGGVLALGASLSLPPQARAQTPASGDTGSPAPGAHGSASSAQNPHAARQAQLLAPNPAEFKRQYDAFVDGKPTRIDGLKLDVPVLADNPSAVPVRVVVTLPVTDRDWCEELILLAERNPVPLACRIFFTPLAGVAEAAVRVRLSQSQTIHALARMKNGQILAARQEVTVAASGCGM